jgi:hypothetical protein
MEPSWYIATAGLGPLRPRLVRLMVGKDTIDTIEVSAAVALTVSLSLSRLRRSRWRRLAQRRYQLFTRIARICRCPAGAFLAANPRARAAAGGCSSCDSNLIVPGMKQPEI